MPSVVSRLQTAAQGSGTITFVGSAAGDAGPADRVEWARLHEDARGMAAALQARGVRPGTHVGLLGPTSRGLVTAIQAIYLAGGTLVSLPLPMRLGSIEEFVEQTRRRIASADAALVVVDGDLAPFLEPPPRARRGGPARRARGRRRAGRCRGVATAARRSRPAGHPAVHERVHRRAQGRDAPRPLRGGEHRRHHRRRAAHARRPRRVVAAAVPRHGSHRPADGPDAARLRARARRAAGLPRSSCVLARVDLGVSGHHHRGPQLLVCARGPRAAACRSARPVELAPRAQRRGDRRSERGRIVLHRGRALRVRRPRRVSGVRHGRGHACGDVPRGRAKA